MAKTSAPFAFSAVLVLINRKARGARKGFGKDFQHKTITHYTSALLAPFAVLF